MIPRRAVRFSDEAEANLTASGITEGQRDRLLGRLGDSLTGPTADLFRCKRSAADAECFEYQNALADTAAGVAHVFTFLVNDTMLANVFVVESIAHTMRPLRKPAE